MEGLRRVGSQMMQRLAESIEYALGLGIGMADLPVEAIQYTEAWETAVASGLLVV